MMSITSILLLTGGIILGIILIIAIIRKRQAIGNAIGTGFRATRNAVWPPTVGTPQQQQRAHRFKNVMSVLIVAAITIGSFLWIRHIILNWWDRREAKKHANVSNAKTRARIKYDTIHYDAPLIGSYTLNTDDSDNNFEWNVSAERDSVKIDGVWHRDSMTTHWPHLSGNAHQYVFRQCKGVPAILHYTRIRMSKNQN